VKTSLLIFEMKESYEKQTLLMISYKTYVSNKWCCKWQL